MAYAPDYTPSQVAPLVRAMGRHLAGKPARLQSAVLADLAATWLAGHIIRRDPVATDALREDLLDGYIALVRQLLPLNAAMIHKTEATPDADHSA